MRLKDNYSGLEIMKNFDTAWKKSRSVIFTILVVLFLLAGNAPQILAHGGEDHGDSQPKTTTNEKGTISHTAHLGGFEIMLKHPWLEPDTATSARLFITKFETNEAVNEVTPAVEIESPNGSVTEAVVEKTDMVGSYNLKFSALSQGTYIVRIKLTYNNETDTATFSGVEVKTQPIISVEGEMSWARTLLIAFIFTVVVALFGGLVYFVWRYAGSSSKPRPVREETVSA